MNAIEELMARLWAQPALRQIGWALVHFLWQGLAVAALTAGALRLLRGSS
ncbi:unnamed protein product, partial [marine sediment metagenome]